MLHGIDVSDWQAAIDWPAVVADLRDRSGGRQPFGVTKATEGVGNVQDTLAANRAEMAAAGMGPVGLYHFAQPGDGRPVAEADHFCDVVGTIGPDEFAVLDIEVGQGSDWPAFIAAWCGRVRDRLAVVPVVYMSESPAKAMPESCSAFPLWVAGYVSRQPDEWEDWRVGPWERPIAWQWTSSGVVAGYGGRVDLNVAPDDLRARIGQRGGPVVGWPEIDRYLLACGVAINEPPEDWQTTGGTHAATSYHYVGQARDYSAGMGCDEAAVVEALRPFAIPGGPIVELFHAATNTWWPENVGGHDDHAHAAIRAGASLPVEEDDMFGTQDREDLNHIKAVANSLKEDFVGGEDGGNYWSGIKRFWRTQQAKPTGGVDVDVLAAKIAEQLGPEIAEAVADKIAARLKD